MNEILQKCTILGFKPCIIKETKEEKIRTCIYTESKKEGYYGDESSYIFLDDTEEKRNLLKKAVDNRALPVFLKVSVDIVNCRSKVIDIIIK